MTAARYSDAFGERIRTARVAKGFTVGRAARDLGISQSYLSMLERGISPPPAEDIIQDIANLVDVDFDELMVLGGRVPSDVLAYLLANPRLIGELRKAGEAK